MADAEHSIELAAPPAESLARIARVADDWGGGWEAEDGLAGRLVIPVVAGLRRGFVVGRVEVGPADAGSRVTFRVEESHYHLQTPAVVILLLAACGALLTVVGLFVHSLLPLVPVGALLAISAWLVIVVRLRNTGPEEFFEFLEGMEYDDG